MKAITCGVVLFLTATSSYALDMHSTQPNASISKDPTAPLANPLPANIDERIRAFIKQSGIDPDSENGRLLIGFVKRVASDPSFRVKLARLSSRQGFADGQFMPEDRYRLLQLMRALATGSKDACRAWGSSSEDFMALAKTASPESFRNLLEVVDIIVTRQSPSASSEEQHSTRELLEADAQLESLGPVLYGRDKAAGSACQFLPAAVDALDALPPASRQNVTYELFNAMSGKKLARDNVLNDPFAYLDDVFDERGMPDSIRHKLPANGSRHLPFARIVIDAEWNHLEAPGQVTPFKDVYLNRRNNGVIAEMVTSDEKSGHPTWVDFNLNYGVVNLMNQTVGREELTRFSTLKDEATVDTAATPMVEGHNIAFALPLPADNGETSRTCDIGKTTPASALFKSLEGDAIDLHCKSVRKTGATVRIEGKLLVDYGITWTTLIESPDGRTSATIRNVTIQQP